MGKLVALGLAMALLLCACGSQNTQDAEETQLVVFAAASLTETSEEIGKAYEAQHPGVKLVFNFDSSGTLKTQIEAGAVCDVFLSAGQQQMDGLEEGGLLLANSRLDLLENKVTLVTADGVELESFAQLAQQLQTGDVLLSMGNSDVPVGQYSQKILDWYGLDEEAIATSGGITYASNVKEVTIQVVEGSVSCGIVYATDATSAGLVPVDMATEEMCGQVIYPGGVVATTEHPEESQDFLAYLSSPESVAVFTRVGFSMAK